MLAVRAGLSLLGLVTAATISVTPVTAQTPCYLPDGTMFIGVQRPADCSPTRPKRREEVIQRNREEAAKLARQRASDDATEAAARREALIQAEVSRRVMGEPADEDGSEAKPSGPSGSVTPTNTTLS
jgi:hypothetical protein